MIPVGARFFPQTGSGYGFGRKSQVLFDEKELGPDFGGKSGPE